jgi:hypothetical protein
MFRHVLGVALSTLLLSGLAPTLAQAQGSEKALRTADRNGDGRIDRREFNERMMDVYFALDADKNGVLAPSEVSGVSAEDFQRADRDRDGALQVEEFMDARAIDFDRADDDDDGTLSAAEADGYSEGG